MQCDAFIQHSDFRITDIQRAILFPYTRQHSPLVVIRQVAVAAGLQDIQKIVQVIRNFISRLIIRIHRKIACLHDFDNTGSILAYPAISPLKALIQTDDAYTVGIQIIAGQLRCTFHATHIIRLILVQLHIIAFLILSDYKHLFCFLIICCYQTHTAKLHLVQLVDECGKCFIKNHSGFRTQCEIHILLRDGGKILPHHFLIKGNMLHFQPVFHFLMLFVCFICRFRNDFLIAVHISGILRKIILLPFQKLYLGLCLLTLLFNQNDMFPVISIIVGIYKLHLFFQIGMQRGIHILKNRISFKFKGFSIIAQDLHMLPGNFKIV